MCARVWQRKKEREKYRERERRGQGEKSTGDKRGNKDTKKMYPVHKETYKRDQRDLDKRRNFVSSLV